MTRANRGLGIVLLVGLWGCAGQPAAVTPSSAAPSASPSTSFAIPAPVVSPSPSAPAASPEPSRSPDPSADPPGPLFAQDAIAAVVTSDLRVRSLPEVSNASKKLEPLLDAPQRVFIVDGPVAASGYLWYQVQPIRTDGELGDLPFGWVAAADKDGTPWLAASGDPCPARPSTAEALYRIPSLVGLACFGGASLKVSGWLAQPEASCGVDIGWNIAPEWLASTCPQPTFLLGFPGRPGESANAVIDPKVNTKPFEPGVERADWLPVTLTGRFDHPASDVCKAYANGEPVPASVSDEAVHLACRATFAITAIANR